MYNADRNLDGTKYAADTNSRRSGSTKTGNGNKTTEIDAVTGAAPSYNWISNSTVSGETIYYDKGSGKYKYKNNIYSTEKAAREARDKAIKGKNKSNTQQNHSTTGTINQIKWL